MLLVGANSLTFVGFISLTIIKLRFEVGDERSSVVFGNKS